MEILYIIHILGVTFGLGGATTSDLLFFRAMRDKKIDASEFALLKTASSIVWAGLILLIFSGAGMIWLGGGIPDNDSFYAKMTIVAVILLNGIFLVHQFIFPFIKKQMGRELISDAHDWRLWLLVASGTISIISWYSAFLLGVLFRKIDLPYLFIISIYIFLITCGMLVAHRILSRFLFKTDQGN